MTWQNRIAPVILLQSPSGNLIEAYWQGNPRNKEKKVGLFEYPSVRGTFGQDLDIKGDRYPLTIFFEGPEHDNEAEFFWQNCNEVGRWVIDHPTKGVLQNMQLLDIEEDIQPVTSANITQFTMNFIQLIGEEVEISASEIGAAAKNQSTVANAQSAEQFDNNVNQEKASFVQSVKNTVSSIQKAVNSTLGPLFETVGEINAAVNSINSGINAALDAVILTPLSLAGQIQQLIQTPALVTRNIESRLDAYSKLASEIFGLDSDSITGEGKNIAATQELALSAIIVAVAGTGITGDLTTRQNAITAVEATATIFSDITDHLDDIQKNFESVSIDNQYFSQSVAFSDMYLLTSQALAFLLLSLFNLQIEKRFILEEGKPPIRICIEEYGTLGENDEFFDIFIETNQLKGNDILFLKAGTEVVVYV